MFDEKINLFRKFHINKTFPEDLKDYIIKLCFTHPDYQVQLLYHNILEKVISSTLYDQENFKKDFQLIFSMGDFSDSKYNLLRLMVTSQLFNKRIFSNELFRHFCTVLVELKKFKSITMFEPSKMIALLKENLEI